MDLISVTNEIRSKICSEIEILSEGKDRYVIAVPFTFEDGDFFKTILKKGDDGWYFTDEGHTLMHLSYEGFDVKLDSGKRKDIFDLILATHGLENDNGELICTVEDEHFGDSLYTFLQGLVKITDITFLKREYAASVFFEEFRGYLKDTFGDKCVFNYKDPEKDPEGRYSIDCCVKYEKPLFVFGLTTNDRCKDAVIKCLTYEKWGVKFTSIAIFEDMEKNSSKVLAMCSDEIDKQYSTLVSAKERVPSYLENMALGMN